MKKEPSGWGYNQTTLFLGDINTGSQPSRLGGLESETVKFGHERDTEVIDIEIKKRETKQSSIV
jgi:hypothetical protein